MAEQSSMKIPATNRKIVLAGGAGLVGQNLVARLVSGGYHNIVVLDKQEKNLQVLKQQHSGVITVSADLAVKGSWMALFEGADTVVILQAQISANHRDVFQRNTVETTQLVLDAVKTHHVPYIVHISSSVLNSMADDDYVQSKKIQEEMVLASGVDCIVLRPTLMFGWFDRKHLGWLARFMQNVPIFPIPGSGRYLRQPLYVGDLCAIIVKCIEKRNGGVFNVTGLEQVDYVDIIALIKRTIKAKAVICHIPVWLFARLLRVWAVFDSNPPFTVAQLNALLLPDVFEVIDWPGIFGVTPTPFVKAVEQTFRDPVYSKIELEF
jgi:nucleoside-diphosphate-sugar epimerase